ncbi:condensation domain-containing protein [Loktanella salsilacus]|uniref:condensation domain-containing protein n=1 Tax=Loktanella salsilacus TaxID=195913 RepID=UPI003735EF4F
MTAPRDTMSLAAPVPEAAPLRFPCSATQERFWFLDQMNPGDPALNVAFRWNIDGIFNATTIEAAFQAVIARQEALRTRFVADQGHPLQEVVEQVRFKMSDIDIRNTPAAQQPDRIDQIARESALQPFDLTEPCQLRVVLIRLGNDHAVLAITVHHICFDGWSIGVLGREVGTYAAALDAGKTAKLDDLVLQFGDFALWQAAFLESEAYAADLHAVCDQLHGAPYFELQPDFPRPLQRSTACGVIAADLPPDWGKRLEIEARKRGMSTFAYGAGVLSALLGRCADAPEVLLGSQVAGRSEIELEPLIGVFINTVVLRLATDEKTALGEHLDRARSAVTDALIGQTVPFNKLVETLNPARDASRTPLVSVNYLLQHVFMETAQYGGFTLSSAPSNAPGALHDLNFSLIGRKSGWRMTLEYNADMFDAATAQELVDLWQSCFALAFDHPECLLSDLPHLSKGPQTRTDDALQLSRIEAALQSYESVGAAAVVPYAAQDGRRARHAFVTLAPDAALMPLEVLPGQLHAHLGAGLAVDGISVLQSLPRDAGGRVIKAQLPLAAALRAAPIAPLQAEAAPCDTTADIAARLVPIWADVLGIEDVPQTTSFFDLGGHSLLIVRLLARIEAEFGHRMTLAEVFQNPTLRALARHLAKGQKPASRLAAERDWRVVTLQEDGDGIPLVAINNANITYALADSMSMPRPAMSLRIYDKAQGHKLEPLAFEQIATRFVEALQAGQPHGPYALFGICVHGNLAIEVARQLKAKGEEVAAVIMKDVWAPHYARDVDAKWSTRWRNRLHFLKVRMHRVAQGTMSVPAFLGTFRVIRATGLLDAAVRFGLMERVRYTDLKAEQEAFIAYLTDARDVHEPMPYDGRVLHIVTNDSPRGRGFDTTMGWGDLITGPMETVYLPDVSADQGRTRGIAQAAGKIEDMLRGFDGAVPGKKGQVNAQ